VSIQCIPAARDPEDRVATHVSAVAERHLAEYECLNIGSVGNQEILSWRGL
jgi:hypothetical protein